MIRFLKILLYLKRNINKGEQISVSDLYSAVPLQKDIGQFSSRDFIAKDTTAAKNLKKDQPITKQDIQ